MKSNVVYYILLLLDSENAVRIPGLGVLTRRVQSAKILTENWAVKPPRASVDFTASGKNKGKLLSRYISYKSGVDPVVADDHVGEFSRTVKSAIHKSGRAPIDYLGVFYQEGDEILFTPDENTVNTSFLGLNTVGLPVRKPHSEEQERASDSVTGLTQEVRSESSLSASELHPVLPAEEEKQLPQEVVAVEKIAEVSSVTQPAATVETLHQEAPAPVAPAKRKRMRVPILLPVFLLIFIGVTALAVMQYNKRGAIYHPAATYNRAPIKDTPIFGSGGENESELSIPPVEDNQVSMEERTVQDVISDNALEMLGLEGTADDKDEIRPVEQDEPLTESKPGMDYQSEDESRPTILDIADDDAVVSDPETNQSISEESQAGNLTSDCYVIVGAFGVQSNVDRMLARLTKMGYAAASMPRNNLTQIGVPAACGSADVQLILKDLQQNVEAEAWIYKK